MSLATLVAEILILIGLAFVIYASVFSHVQYWQNHSIKEEPHCLPEAQRGNECLVGVQHWAPANVHYCTVESRLEGVHCSSGCVADGHCDGAGVCVGTSDLACAVDLDCPALTVAAGVNTTAVCDLGRCSYSATTAGPFGTCGSPAAAEACAAVIADSDFSDCLSTGELCDSGLVIACTYTAAGVPLVF